MVNVAIVLATGYEEIEAITVIDILRRAKINVDIISNDNKDYVIGANDVVIKTDCYFADINKDYQMLILPGGELGVKNLQKNSQLMDLLKEFHFKNRFIAAICAAPQILGILNLVANKNVAVYPGCTNGLLNAKISTEAVCIDNNIITAASAGTAMKFALELVGALINNEVKEAVRQKLLIL